MLHVLGIAPFTESYVLRQPEILAPRAEEHVAQEGNPRDEATRQLIGTMLTEFAAWIERMGS